MFLCFPTLFKSGRPVFQLEDTTTRSADVSGDGPLDLVEA